jgi:hypothetical protein
VIARVRGGLPRPTQDSLSERARRCTGGQIGGGPVVPRSQDRGAARPKVHFWAAAVRPSVHQTVGRLVGLRDGIGGLGHLGVKLAHPLGAHVVAFTTSPSKSFPRFSVTSPFI